MNKRGVVLIFALLVTLVLSGLMVSFFIQSIGENQLVKTFINSTRAFWLAEAGIAEVLGNPGLTDKSGYIDNPNHTYNAIVSGPLLGTTDYYKIDATGSIALPAGENVSRALEVIVKIGSVDPSKFKYGIETTTDLVIKGSSVDINPDDSWKEYSTLDFADLFTISKADMKANANHLYTSSNFIPHVEEITWVDVETGSKLTIADNLIGSGIFVINGDAHFSGTINFYGIIYVIGKLTITGDVISNGSVLAESSTTVDTELKGNVTINHSPSDIANALLLVQFLTKKVVSWQEM